MREEIGWSRHAGKIAADRDDISRDSPLLREGRVLSHEMGKRLLEGWIELRIAETAASTDGRPSCPDGLTDREVEVPRLVVEGFTAQDITNLLLISVKTVATRLAQLFEKTGSANRAEATACAFRQGLAGEQATEQDPRRATASIEARVSARGRSSSRGSDSPRLGPWEHSWGSSRSEAEKARGHESP